QVGGIRAALYIAKHHADAPMAVGAFAGAVADQVKEVAVFCKRTCGSAEPATRLTPAQVIGEVQTRMSGAAGHIRDPSAVSEAARSARALLERLPHDLRVRDAKSLPVAFRAVDLCLTHWVYLEAIQAYLNAGGRSRGSALVLDSAGERPGPGLEDAWRFALNAPGAAVDRQVLEVWVDGEGELGKRWVAVRPVPSEDGWFEQVWRDYREGSVIE
ncbi:MAG: hypothetical protein PVJ43_06340, partial [Gemmatimonadales bacterium]